MVEIYLRSDALRGLVANNIVSQLKAPLRVLFKFIRRGREFVLHKIPDGIFARNRPRGFCLSRFAGVARTQTKTSLRASNLYAIPSSWYRFQTLRKIKNPLTGVLNFRRGRDSNSRYGFPYAVFPGLCLKPLGHLSKKTVRGFN